MKPEKNARRSSILKPPKARNPLSDLDSEQQNAQDDDVTTFDKNKRVSFSATKGIAVFTMNDQGKTIWHDVYEEPNANMSESTDMAESLVQKLEASLDQQQSQNIGNNSNVKFNPTEDNEDSEHCINISAMIGDLAKFCPKKPILELTNPSLTDHTEALINYKIAHNSSDRLSWDLPKPSAVDFAQDINKTMNNISNEESSCEMSITQVMSVDIETKEVPKPSVNTYVYPNVNKENWVQDKENISIPLNVNAYENDNRNRYSIINRAQLKNSLVENDKAAEQNCDMNFTNVISKMIEDIENNSPNTADNVNVGLKRKSSDNLEEMLPESIGDKRKTIIFDYKSSDCNMSMTSAVPMSVQTKREEIIENMNHENKTKYTKQNDHINIPKLSINKIKHTEDMSMADFLPNMASTQIFNIDEKKLTNMINKKKVDEQKTIIFNQNEADCDVSMTNVLPNIKFQASEEKSNDVLTNNPKRKTIIYNEETAGCNMSMTAVLPTSDINNAKPINDKRKTIIFNQEDPGHNMSMTTVLPSTGICISDKNFGNVIEKEEKKDVIFNENNATCNMSMTNILPSGIITKNDRKSIQCIPDPINNEKRKTIIFNPEESVCNMSMTTVLPSVDISKHERKSIQCIPEPINTEKRKTIIFNPEESICNMSMTTVLPPVNLSKNERKSIQHVNDADAATNNEKRKTIIFSPEKSVCNMSMTTVLPSVNLSKNDRKSIQCIQEPINNEKRKTIIFNPEESVCNMSMTTVLPSVNLSKNDRKSIQSVYDTETINNEKRKTIIFSPEESVCNMSMTTALPSGGISENINDGIHYNENVAIVNSEKRKTIIFDQNNSECNISMTSVLPSVNAPHIAINENIENVCEKTKTIIFNQKDTECNMSITNISPHINFMATERKSVITKENIVNDDNKITDSKRKTIIFNQSDAECDISMTNVFSSTNIIENMKTLDDDQKKSIVLEENIPTDVNSSNTKMKSVAETNYNNIEDSLLKVFDEIDDPKNLDVSYNDEKIDTVFKKKPERKTSFFNETKIPTFFINKMVDKSLDTSNEYEDDENAPSMKQNIKSQENKFAYEMGIGFGTNSFNTSVQKTKSPMSPLNNIITKKRKTSFFNETNIPTFVIDKMQNGSNTSENEDDESGAENSIIEEKCIQNEIVDHEQEDYNMEVSYYESAPIVTDSNNLICKNLEEEEPNDNVNANLNKIESICNVSTDNYGNNSEFINNDDKDCADGAEIVEKSIKLDSSMQKIANNSTSELNNSKNNQEMYNNSALVEDNGCIVNSGLFDHRKSELRHEENLVAHELSQNKENSMKELKNHEIMHNTLISNMEISDINKSITIVKHNELNALKNFSMKNLDVSNINDEENHIEKSFEFEENSKYKSNFTENFPENENSFETSYKNTSDLHETISNSHTKNDSPSSLNSSKTKLLANISDISLVDTSHDSVQNCEVLQNNSIFSDGNTLTSKTNSVSNNESLHSKCSQDEIPQPSMEDVFQDKIPQRSIEDVFQDIIFLDLDKFNCRSQFYNESEWSFYLCQDSLILKIQFYQFKNEILNPKTIVSDVILEPTIDKNVSCEISCAQIAIMNQLPINELKSMCKNCDDVPKLLSHCSDVSKKARRWIKVLKFLYLQHGLQYNSKKLSFKLANGLLRAIWEIVIDVKDLPYATPDNVTINVICGESTIAKSTFKSLIERVECDWDYLKNLADNLYNFIKESSRIKPLCNA